MGEYINLLAAMRRGQSDAPAAVCQRYSCDQPQATVTFKVRAETRWGEHVYLVGSDPVLSSWQPASGIQLSPATYPVWTVRVSLPAAKSFEYKYIKLDDQGTVVWESGGNRVLTTPASGEIARDEVFR
jgi:glucoamylase